MSAAWNAVHLAAQLVCPDAAHRVANLVIAAATRHARATQAQAMWEARMARAAVSELALTPLPTLSEDASAWQQLADLAMEAAPLGMDPKGMHTWAAAYQRASTTQKALGAYATHDAFASALARITMAPLATDRIHRIVDPSVGAGNLLLAAIEQFGQGQTDSHLRAFILNLHGVELDPRARELCCLLLWLVGMQSGVTLPQVAANIQIANALTRDWWSNRDLFEVVLMNPPWESLRQKVDDDHGDERAATLARLSQIGAGALGLPPLYSAQGTGDRNLFKAFVELVPHLLEEGGRLGALLPAAFASDAGMSALRERYLTQFDIARWTSYENRARYFPIDSRYKFGLLAATRSNGGTQRLYVRSFATEPDEVEAAHIALDRQDIALIGRAYHIIPELADQRELEALRCALSTGVPLFQRGPFGKVVYRREIDLSLHKTQFHHVAAKSLSRVGDGTYLDGDATAFVPLMEGRSVGAYDCAQKSWVSGAGRTAAWVNNDVQSLAEYTPQYVITPLTEATPRIALCDVTASTNTRTVIATLVPAGWRCGNTAPVLAFDSELHAFAALGVLNSMVFDWVARRLVSGLHLNKFILEGLVWPQLSEQDVEQLAFAAWSICRTQPRSGLSVQALASPPWLRSATGSHPQSPLDYVQASAAIEVTTARGLGLNHAQLAMLYDPKREDRRGFWRYFDANRLALAVTQAALAVMQTVDPGTIARQRPAQAETVQFALDWLEP